MIIAFDRSELKHEKWKDYAIRFVFGGSITMLTGIIATHYGPGIAGLFLSFPAIFPASATLIEKHEKQKKERAGMNGTIRGRSVASLDAKGASLGGIGMLVFALVVWELLPHHDPWLILTSASVIWIAVSILLWWIRKSM